MGARATPRSTSQAGRHRRRNAVFNLSRNLRERELRLDCVMRGKVRPRAGRDAGGMRGRQNVHHHGGVDAYVMLIISSRDMICTSSLFGTN
jgi:hypothetical protein